jgi:hypothetical protein
MKPKNYASIIAALFAVVVAVYNFGCGTSQQIPPPPISVSVLPSAPQSVDQGQTVNLTANVQNDSSSKGVTWSVSGASCAGAACGTLSNQTATSATYTAPGALAAKLSVTVTATSMADSTKSAPVSVTAFPPPTISSKSLPNATGGGSYSQTLQESGGVAPFTWSLASGSTLPPGLSLSSDGTISGTPTEGGPFNFTVQIADSGNPPVPASANVSLTVVVLPLSITTLSLQNGTVDTMYSQSLQATGGIPPYSWSMASGSLPSWATLNPTTGEISGIPGTTGTADFKIQVADSETPAFNLSEALAITVLAGSAANDAELNGHYAFLFNGFDDVTGSQLAITGSFAADGKGNIAAGVQDENGPSGAFLNVPFTGTYNIGSDNRGAITIDTAAGTKTYALVLSSISGGVAQKARFIEFDDTSGKTGTRGSGFLRMQDTTAFTLGGVTGPYAFGFAGQDATGKRDALVGSFNADGKGVIPSGVADQNVAGTASNPSLTGSYEAPSSTNGRATMTLNPSGASSLDLSAYVISANELLVLTTNAFSSGGVLSGSMFSQTSTSFSNGSLNAPAVYYQVGVNPSAATSESFAELGLMATDGKGGLNTAYDSSNGGVLSGNQTFAATYSVLAGGRVTISGWYANSTSPLRILYLVDQNKAFFLDTSSSVGFGFVEPQAPGPFSNASLSGTFPAATAAPSVSLDPNACGLATLDASGTFTEIASASVASGQFIDRTTSGKYSIATNGRGFVQNITITTAGIGASMLGVFAIMLPVGIFRRRLRERSRAALAIFCLTALMATSLGACIPPVNQLIFYVISPTKAVLMHESRSDHTPVVTIIEK